MTVQDIPLSEISPTDLNPRKHFDEAGLDELAESIRTLGLIEPIVVWPAKNAMFTQPVEPGATYLIAVGERRWRAAHLAGVGAISADVRVDLTDRLALEITVAENLQRKDLNPLEEAHGYASMKRLLAMKDKDVAEKLGVGVDTVREAVRLLDLPPTTQDALSQGLISKAIARILWERLRAFPDICATVTTYIADREYTAAKVHKDIGEITHFAAPDLIREIRTWNPPFDLEICRACPFGAFMKAGGYGADQICLKPEHYAELEANAQKLRDEEAQQRIDELRAKNPGKDIDTLDHLDYSTFEDLTHTDRPTGCSLACPCSQVGIRNNRPVQLCTDPKRFNGLKMKKARLEMKLSRLAAGEAKLQAAAAADDIAAESIDMSDAQRRMFNLVLRAALHQTNQHAPIRDAAKKLGAEDIAKTVADWPTSSYDVDDLKALEQMKPEAALRLAAYMMLFPRIDTAAEAKQDPWEVTYVIDGAPRTGNYWQAGISDRYLKRCDKCGNAPCNCPPSPKTKGREGRKP